jgi:acyl-coenzyme A synthetase/AMP-(fatty) acid ligase
MKKPGIGTMTMHKRCPVVDTWWQTGGGIMISLYPCTY